MENFFTVARQVFVLFALIGAGALMRKRGLINEAAASGIVNVLIIAVTPCLIIEVFQRPFNAAMLRELGIAFIIAFCAHIAIIIASSLMWRRKDDSSCVLRLATVFSNAGFMGIPLEQAIFGDIGVFYGITYVATFNFIIWSWGLAVMKKRSGDGTMASNWKIMVLNPGTVGLSTGLALFILRIKLPGMIATPISMMASMNTPLAMIAIGYYLAGANLGAVMRSYSAYVASLARLVIYPLALVAALYPLRGILEREMMLALVTAASAPVAAMVAMFSAKFDRDTDLAVGLVSGTTLLSMLTMPAAIAIAMAVL